MEKSGNFEPPPFHSMSIPFSIVAKDLETSSILTNASESKRVIENAYFIPTFEITAQYKCDYIYSVYISYVYCHRIDGWINR